MAITAGAKVGIVASLGFLASLFLVVFFLAHDNSLKIISIILAIILIISGITVSAAVPIKTDDTTS